MNDELDRMLNVLTFIDFIRNMMRPRVVCGHLSLLRCIIPPREHDLKVVVGIFTIFFRETVSEADTLAVPLSKFGLDFGILCVCCRLHACAMSSADFPALFTIGSDILSSGDAGGGAVRDDVGRRRRLSVGHWTAQENSVDLRYDDAQRERVGRTATTTLDTCVEGYMLLSRWATVKFLTVFVSEVQRHD